MRNESGKQLTFFSRFTVDGITGDGERRVLIDDHPQLSEELPSEDVLSTWKETKKQSEKKMEHSIIQESRTFCEFHSFIRREIGY